jgi:arginyl-tRNA synthetase
MPPETLQAEIVRVLREMGVDGDPPVTLERPRNPDHGDWATNVALTLARPLARPPRG